MTSEVNIINMRRPADVHDTGLARGLTCSVSTKAWGWTVTFNRLPIPTHPISQLRPPLKRTKQEDEITTRNICTQNTQIEHPHSDTLLTSTSLYRHIPPFWLMISLFCWDTLPSGSLILPLLSFCHTIPLFFYLSSLFRKQIIWRILPGGCSPRKTSFDIMLHTRHPKIIFGKAEAGPSVQTPANVEYRGANLTRIWDSIIHLDDGCLVVFFALELRRTIYIHFNPYLSNVLETSRGRRDEGVEIATLTAYKGFNIFKLTSQKPV